MNRIAAFLLFLTCLASVAVHGLDSVTLGSGVDGIIDVGSDQPYSIAPWIDATVSVSGYPNLALSWFIDGAGRASIPFPDTIYSIIGVLTAGGSYRSGLSSIRVDVETMVDAEIGGSILFDVSPGLSFSTGGPDFSIYAEVTGRGAFSTALPGPDISGRGKIGYSFSLLNQLAPALEAFGTYTEFRDQTLRYTYGVSADSPWYPNMPGTFDFRIALLRSSGDFSIESLTGSVYYPDRYWEISSNAGMGIAPSRSMLIEVGIPMAVRRADHGALIAGEPTSSPQITFSATPGTSITLDITRRLSAKLDIGVAFSLSNSPDAVATRYYTTLGAEYAF